MLGCRCLFFFFNDTATTEIYTLSLHDALPICIGRSSWPGELSTVAEAAGIGQRELAEIVGWAVSQQILLEEPGILQMGDRKSTRLNSSHANISYAAFCLKKNIRCSYLRRGGRG